MGALLNQFLNKQPEKTSPKTPSSDLSFKFALQQFILSLAYALGQQEDYLKLQLENLKADLENSQNSSVSASVANMKASLHFLFVIFFQLVPSEKGTTSSGSILKVTNTGNSPFLGFSFNKKKSESTIGAFLQNLHLDIDLAPLGEIIQSVATPEVFKVVQL